MKSKVMQLLPNSGLRYRQVKIVNFIPQVCAKIQRAAQLIETLDALCIAFLDAQNIYLDKVVAGRNKWDLVLRMTDDPPLDFGVLVGDVVHNLRSSLDIGIFHYLRDAYPESFAKLDSRALTRIKFPIFDSAKGYSSTRWHGGLANEQLLIDLIEVQPFRNIEFLDSEVERQNFVKSSPLWQLQTLWNTDKHRGISVVLGGLNMLALGLDVGEDSIWTQRDTPPWRNGSTIFTIEVRSESDITNLNISENFALGLESDVQPLQIYPIVSKLQALLSATQHAHWVLKRWNDYR